MTLLWLDGMLLANADLRDSSHAMLAEYLKVCVLLPFDHFCSPNCWSPFISSLGAFRDEVHDDNDLLQATDFFQDDGLIEKLHDAIGGRLFSSQGGEVHTGIAIPKEVCTTVCAVCYPSTQNLLTALDCRSQHVAFSASSCHLLLLHWAAACIVLRTDQSDDTRTVSREG